MKAKGLEFAVVIITLIFKLKSIFLVVALINMNELNRTRIFGKVELNQPLVLYHEYVDGPT